VPIAATQLAQIAVSTTNLALMGRLGVTQLAAGGLAMVLFNQVRTMCVGLITASGNRIATSAGRRGSLGRTCEIRAEFRASMLVATGAGVLAAAVLIALSWGLRLLGQDPAVLADARPMMLALAPGLLPCLWFQALRQYSVGLQRPQALLTVTLGSVALNLVLALGLMNGEFGLPRLGLTGIGLASSLVHLASFAALAMMVRRDPVLGAALPRRLWPVDPARVRAELRLGAPIAATYGSEAGMFSVLALVMGALGPAALAAHNVVYQLVYLVFQLAVGLSHGASILVSDALARAEHRHAHRLPRIAFTQSAAVLAAVGVAYLLLPDRLLHLFAAHLDGPATHIAHSLLLVAIGLQFFDAAQNIAVGLLRGIAATAAGFRLSVIGYWLVGVPAAALLAFPGHLGALGVWLGLTAGLATTAGLMTRRYFALLRTAIK
jgi:MATE family multidrug resistance protein